MIASTATNWIGAGAAAVGALGAIAVVILGVIVARRQGRIEASQLEISKELRELDARRFAQERAPLLVVERSGLRREEILGAEVRYNGPFDVTIRNAGRGPALLIRTRLMITTNQAQELDGGWFERDLIMPGAFETAQASIPGFEIPDGTAWLTGWCVDVDGNRHPVGPPS